MSSVGSSLPFLDVLREDLVVIGSKLLGLLEARNLGLLGKLLSSESLLSNESLDLRALVEGLVTLLNFAADDVLSDIILLAESEDLTDSAGSLGSLSAGLGVSGNAIDVSITLLDDGESNDGKIGTADATTDRLSLSLASSSGSVGCGPYIKNFIRFSIN